MVRMIIAAVVAGIVMFIWSAVAHMALPIGEMGVKTIPNEAAVIDALKGSLTEPGFYLFPGFDMSQDVTEAQEQEWQARYEAGPIGVLVYSPTGKPLMSSTMLGTELVADILAALLAAVLVSRMASGFMPRVIAAGSLGLIAWLSVNVSHWNWHSFPSEFVMGEAIDLVVGWLLAGVALAAIIKPAARGMQV